MLQDCHCELSEAIYLLLVNSIQNFCRKFPNRLLRFHLAMTDWGCYNRCIMPELPEVDPKHNLPRLEDYIHADEGRLDGAGTMKEENA